MNDTSDTATRAAHSPTAAGTSDALDALMADHRAVEKLFDAFDRAEDGAAETRGALVQRACEELTIHTMLEEELLYPAAKQALGPAWETDVDEVGVEHFLVKTLIAKFETLTPDDQGFNATFRVMADMVRHHIDEEESRLFPALRKSGLDRARLGIQIAHRKDELTRRLEAAGSRLVGDMSFVMSPADIGAAHTNGPAAKGGGAASGRR